MIPATGTVGLSASTEKAELYASEIELRQDIPELLAARRALRGARRSRKTRYRAPRFDKVALLTTLMGLIAAVILQLFYNYIVSKIDSLVNEMEDTSITLTDILTAYNKK